MKLEELYHIISDRRDHPTDMSYTASLFRKGEDEIVKKVGEEAVEVIIAAKSQGEQRIIEEVADLTYHVLVLLANYSIPLSEIEKELAKRHR